MPRRGREPGQEPEWIVPALAGVFALSGAAGLIHEVVWARLLARVSRFVADDAFDAILKKIVAD